MSALSRAALVLTTGGAGAAVTADPTLPSKLVKGVTVDKMNKHLIAFQRYADQNGATRAAGTTGHDKSANYVAAKLEGARFTVTKQTARTQQRADERIVVTHDTLNIGDKKSDLKVAQ